MDSYLDPSNSPAESAAPCATALAARAPLKRDLVAGLEKGLAVIEAFDQERPRLTISEVAERTGLTLASIQQPLAEAEAKGLLERDLARAWPTAKGFDFLSDLQALFLKD